MISGVPPVHPVVMGICIAGSQRCGASHITVPLCGVAVETGMLLLAGVEL